MKISSHKGHYVPEITAKIFEMNDSGARRINIEGFMVGNAWTDPPVDNAGALDTWWLVLGIESDSGIMRFANLCLNL